MTETRRHIVLAARPDGVPTQKNFSLETGPLPEPGPDQMLVRTIWLSLDPYMRGRMDSGKSYADPVELGSTMEGAGVGEVIASNAKGFEPGDYVVGRTGWASHAVIDAAGTLKVDPEIAPISTALGVLGMPGLTAWVGLSDILQISPGETVLISAATGAVGSVAVQIAKARGLRVIGVAGGPEKCAYAEEKLGADACLDHRLASDARALSDQIGQAAPDGIDAYFENVGGKTLQAVLPQLNEGGRIAICGMIAWYSGQGLDDAMPLPAVWRTILVKRLRVQGFLVFDHAHRQGDFLAEVAPMVRDGRLHYRESIAEGLDAAPKAFLGMLAGENFGKQLVRVGPGPD